MMTIKAPIELKVRTDLTHGYDAFGERIAGNYALMGLEIGEEELLHMVSSPPEIYLMDGGSVSVGGNTFISSNNEEKVNIVNNMLNRILLSTGGAEGVAAISRRWHSLEWLRQMLRRLKSMPVDAYRGLIERQWKWFHTSRREGDFQLKNFWLEENLNVWVDMCRLRQKTLELSVQGVLKQYKDRKKAEAEKTIFKNDNIQITK